VKGSIVSNIVAFSQAGLPAVSSLSTALRAIAPDVGSATVIVKMDKTGHWVFGADQTEVEDGSLWAVNPFSFVHGFIAWGADKTPVAGTVLGEKMVGITQPLPEMGPAPENNARGWEPQVGFSLKCISGEDASMEARFAVTSVGGRRAVQGLAVAIAAQVEKDQTKPVPVIVLGKDHYQHKSYGRVYVPVLDVQHWVGMDGAADEATEPAEAPAAEPAPTGRRRRAA
jgi:hypothetical protein